MIRLKLKLSVDYHPRLAENKMKGDLPTDVGNLVLLNHLDFRKCFDFSIIILLISQKIFYMLTQFLDFLGDYDVIGDSTSKTIKGTLPTELGLLTSWKYIILRKYI